MPDTWSFLNKTIDSKTMKKIVADMFRRDGRQVTVEFLDRLKNLGFRYATYSGISIGMGDVTVPELKYNLVNDATDRVNDIRDKYNAGVISDGERGNQDD